MLLVFGTAATYTVSEGEHQRGKDHDRAQRFRDWAASESDPLLHTVAWANLLAVARLDRSYAEPAARLAIDSLQRYLTQQCLDPRCGGVSGPIASATTAPTSPCNRHTQTHKWFETAWEALVECRAIDPVNTPSTVEFTGQILRDAWFKPPISVGRMKDITVDLGNCVVTRERRLTVISDSGMSLSAAPVTEGTFTLVTASLLPLQIRGKGTAHINITDTDWVELNGLVVAQESHLLLNVPSSCRVGCRRLTVDGMLQVNVGDGPLSSKWELTGVTGSGAISLQGVKWAAASITISAETASDSAIPSILIDDCHFDGTDVTITGLGPARAAPFSRDSADREVGAPGGREDSASAQVANVRLVHGAQMTWTLPLASGLALEEVGLNTWTVEGSEDRERRARLELVLDVAADSSPTITRGRLIFTASTAKQADIVVSVKSLSGAEIEVNLDNLASEPENRAPQFDSSASLEVRRAEKQEVRLSTHDPVRLVGIENALAGEADSLADDPAVEGAR